MRFSTLLRSLRVGLAALGLAGCATDSSTGPTTPVLPAQPNAGLLTDLVSKKALLWKWTYEKDIVVAADIDKDGGTIKMKEAGFTLIVPKGAVNKKTHFVITATQGDIVAFEFEPHGTTFKVPLTAKQDLSTTEWKSGLVLSAGYFTDRSNLLQDAGKVLVSETVSGVTNLLTHEFTFPIKHFSGYTVAW
jgi:hypothetical protein